MRCQLCLKEFDAWYKLSQHLNRCEKNKNPIYTSETYYIKFLNSNPVLRCSCGKDLKFVSLEKGYKRYCSIQCCNKDPKRKLAIRNTNIKKYGGPAPLCDSKIFQKFKNTCINIYGCDSPMKSDIVKSKHVQTTLDHYGCKNISQSEDIKNIKKQKSIISYGTEYIFQSEVVKDIIKNTNLSKYGTENPMQNLSIIQKMKDSRHKKFFDFLIKSDRLGDAEPLFEENEYSNNNNHEYHFKCKKCGIEFIDRIDCGKVPRCLKCNPIDYMGIENEIVDFISSIYNGKIIRSTYKIIPPKQIDIYIPDLKIAIEVDGLYWHSYSIISDKNYHISKSDNCLKQGIALFHIFEDEWINKKNIVCSRLKSIFNNKSLHRIHARKCIIKKIDNNEKNEFLEKNHIQGSDISSIRLGAFYNNELVSVMTFSKPNISKGGISNNDTWELNRFCNKLDYSVVGIASKLLTYFTRNYQWHKIFSYADRRWSNGNLYRKLGFLLEGETGPNYWYIIGSVRYHRYNFRKNILKSKLKIYDKNLSESQLMKLNKIDKIYDCGSYKFSMLNNSIDSKTEQK